MQILLKYSFWVWVLAGVFCLLFFLKPTDLTTSDLGRHLMNGKELLAGNWGVLTTNYYSYTTPDFHFVNHHWLFGVVSYLMYTIGGFGIVTVVFALLYALAPMVISLWWLPNSKAKWLFAAGSMLIVLPMLHSRIETRPEAISAIFLAVTPFLWRWWVQAKTRKQLLLAGGLFALMHVVWVNSHIFWIFAPLIGGGYFIEAWIEKNWQQLRRITLLGCILLVASLVTPLGAKILLYPFGIFTNYAYPVAENQTLFFFLQNYPSIRWWYELIFIAFFGVVIGLFWQQVSKPLRPLLYGTVLLLLGNILMVRIASFAGLFIVPLITWFLWTSWEGVRFVQEKYKLTLDSPLFAMTCSIGAAIAIAILTLTPLYNPMMYGSGIGLSSGVEKAAELLRQPELAEKIVFNNYDIGGYLIWYQLRPKYVYFDNRPEAYPQEFVEGEAIGSQIDDEKWKDTVAKYSIELIVFNRYDQTDWGQPFLVRRLQDPEWVPIHFDDYAIILLKNTEANKAFIDAHRVPLDSILSAK